MLAPSTPISSTCVGSGSPICEAFALATRLRLPVTDALTVTALAGATGAAGTGRIGTGTGAGAGVAGTAPGAVRSGRETVRLRCGVLGCVRAVAALPRAELFGADGAAGRSAFVDASAAAGRLT